MMKFNNENKWRFQIYLIFFNSDFHKAFLGLNAVILPPGPDHDFSPWFNIAIHQHFTSEKEI